MVPGLILYLRTTYAYEVPFVIFESIDFSLRLISRTGYVINILVALFERECMCDCLTVPCVLCSVTSRVRVRFKYNTYQFVNSSNIM